MRFFFFKSIQKLKCKTRHCHFMRVISRIQGNHISTLVLPHYRNSLETLFTYLVHALGAYVIPVGISPITLAALV